MQTLNTALMAVELASPSKLTVISRAAYIQTAAMGVCDRWEICFQTEENGKRSSRARAKIVRLPDCRPGIATRFMTTNPQRVKKMAGARPMALKNNWATCEERTMSVYREETERI